MQNNSEHKRPFLSQLPRRFTDERLAQELAFATSFDDPMPEAQAWLAALMAERERRSEQGPSDDAADYRRAISELQ